MFYDALKAFTSGSIQARQSLVATSTQAFLPLELAIVTDPELSHLLVRARAGNALSDEERFRYATYLRYQLLCFQSLWHQANDGVMTKDEWARTESTLVFLGSTREAAAILIDAAKGMDPSFATVVERLLTDTALQKKSHA